MMYFTSSSLSSGRTGEPYEGRINVTGNLGTQRFSILEGQLPPGLEIARDTGWIHGTPEADGGYYGFTVAVADPQGGAISRDFEIRILAATGTKSVSRSPLPGFNGERLDPVTGMTHLGHGYRAYNPVLMRFNCPDSLSPFGAGGINPYAYCAGDPINRADPSGHISFGGFLGAAISLVGLLMALPTGGASLAMNAAFAAFDIAMGLMDAGAEAGLAELSASAVDEIITSTSFREFREIWSTNRGYSAIKALSRTTGRQELTQPLSGKKVVEEITGRYQYRFDGASGKTAEKSIIANANTLDSERVGKYSAAMYRSAQRTYLRNKTVGTYYRGQRISEDHLRLLLNGNNQDRLKRFAIRSNGLMAVSSEKNAALDFMRGAPQHQPLPGRSLLVQIKGGTAIHMDSSSAVLSEAESVFTPYASFKFSRIFPQDDYFVMEMDEIAYSPTAKFYNNIIGGFMN